MNKRHPLDELFSQHLRDASAPVPENMWSRIEKARQQKRRRLLVVWNSVGSVSLTLLAAVWMYVAGPELGSFPLEESGQPTTSETINNPSLASAESTTTFSSTAATDIAEEESSSTSIAATTVNNANNGTAVRRTVSKNKGKSVAIAAANSPRVATEQGSTVESSINTQNATATNTTDITESPVAIAEDPIEESTRIAGPHQRNRVTIVDILPEKNISFAKQEEIRLFTNHPPRCADFTGPFFRLDLEMLGGPAYAHQTLRAKTSESQAHLRLRERSESAGLSFSGGFRLAASSNVGLGLRTGITYTEINDRFTFDVGSRMDVSVIFDPNGEIIGRDTTYTEGYQDTRRNTLRFVEIPLLLGYERQWGKLRVGVNAGAFLNLVFDADGAIYSPATEEPIDFGQQGDRDVLPIFDRTATAAWYAGMSIAYNLHSRYSIIAEPYFKTFPKALSSSAYDLQQNYWMTGMQLGMRMRL